MATNSKIEWTHHTFNPWRGCTKVSDGCKNCYAETMSKRNPRVLGIWGDNGTRVVASESMWCEPVKWNAQAAAIQEMWEHSEGPKGDRPERPRVFCASLADVCEDRDDVVESRMRLMRVIEATPNLDWLLLTKRPQNFNKLFWGPEPWPPNVWVGTSCENQQAADERIPHLLKVPAAIRFLSCEPLLGPIDLERLRCGTMEYADGKTKPVVASAFSRLAWGGSRDHTEQGTIHWIIAGGESGSGARPCNIAWIRSIRDQCKAAGVAFFNKQLGARPVGQEGVDVITDDRGAEMTVRYKSLPPAVTAKRGSFERRYELKPKDPKGGAMSEWPEDLQVREMPEVRSAK